MYEACGLGGLRKNAFCRGSMDNIYELLSYNIKKTRAIKINNIINRISAVFQLHCIFVIILIIVTQRIQRR